MNASIFVRQTVLPQEWLLRVPLVTDQHFLTLDQYKQPVQMHSFMLDSTL